MRWLLPLMIVLLLWLGCVHMQMMWLGCVRVRHRRWWILLLLGMRVMLRRPGVCLVRVQAVRLERW